MQRLLQTFCFIIIYRIYIKYFIKILEIIDFIQILYLKINFFIDIVNLNKFN